MLRNSRLTARGKALTLTALLGISAQAVADLQQAAQFNPNFSPAQVALQAVHDAKIKVGDRVAIFGMGVIGLLAVQLARLSGAAWIDAVDLFTVRRDLALSFGANRALDPGACDVGYEIKMASPQRGADVAIEVSGHYAALHEAIRSARKSGTVVAAGYYQGGGTPLRLGEEWHHNRITMISSMAVWNNPHRDYPAWDRIRINSTVTDLMAAGRLRGARARRPSASLRPEAAPARTAPSPPNLAPPAAPSRRQRCPAACTR